MSVLSDREEGEIVDDYEYILSSDEENCRQRMQELEAENYELEQIAQISGVYSNTYDSSSRYENNRHDNANVRSAYIPTDVSSISSVEFEKPVRKFHRSRHREGHKRKHSRRSRSRHRNRYKHYAPEDDEDHLTRLHARITEELDTISVASDSEHIKIPNKKDEILSYTSRAKLRFAVTRNVNGYKAHTALKERLLKENNFLPIEVPETKKHTNTDKHKNKEDVNKTVDDEDFLSADEQELRLIALKSAVINKHIARKHRDEVAYSPSDNLDEFLHNSENLGAIDDNTMELDMTDLAVGMDISPVISPDVTSPTSPIDMDIAQSDSDLDDIVTPPSPILPPPPPPITDNWQSYTNMEYPAAMHYGIYMPEMQYQQPPPPPPPPLPDPATETPPASVKNTEASKETAIIDEEDEQALRALLLAKIQQTKTREKSNVISELEQEKVKKLKQAVLRFRQKTQAPTETLQFEMIQKETEAHNEIVPVVQRPKITIRSVSEINKDYEEQQMPDNAEVLEINSTVEEIVISDSEDGDESVPATLHNKRALSDINFNVKNRTNLIVTPLDKTITQKSLNKNTNIPNAEATKSNSSDLISNKTSLNDTKSVFKCKEVTNKSNNSTKITARRIKTATNIFCNGNSNAANNVDCSTYEKEGNSVTMGDSMTPNTKQLVDLDVENPNNQSNEPSIKTNPNNTKNSTFNEIPTLEVPYNDHEPEKSIITSTDIIKTTTALTIATMPITRSAIASSSISSTVIKSSTCATKSIQSPTACSKSATDSCIVSTMPALRTVKSSSTTTTISTPVTKPKTGISVPTTTRSSTPVNLTTSKISPNNRLITTIPKIHVPKMIISLNPSDSDENDHNEDNSIAMLNVDSSLDISDLDFYNYDNTSPISLPMDSPVNGTSRCVTPSNDGNELNEGLPTRTVVNDIFQQRLDNFLKTARTSIPVNTKTTIATPNSSTSKEKPTQTSTPTALRHLPVSAQQEYRNLMLRMKMLEEQKKKKLSNEKSLIETDGNSTTPKTKKPITPPNNATTFVSANKKTLIKKVLVKNATNTSPSPKAETAASAITSTKYNYNNKHINNNKQQTNSVAKINALQTYEKSYEKLGGVIVMKLDKSLQQVSEARKTKIDKFFYEEEVRQLKLQLRVAQKNLNEAQNKMQQIFPTISGTNQLIATLKRRRMKLYKAANVLGKSIKGDDYSLRNNVKEDISKKSEKLALAIKEVNTIKANNIKNIKRKRIATTTTKEVATNTSDQATMTELPCTEIEEVRCYKKQQIFNNLT